MSAKRVIASSTDWAAFVARVPKSDINNFNIFKGKCDTYLRNVVALPATLPKIHWDQYTARVAVPGMVEDFKKKYESLQLAYPEDKYSAKITEVEKITMEEVKEFVAKSNARVEELKAELAKWESMTPFSEMTLEEFTEYFPEKAYNPDKPTMWPHTPEAQPGYKHPEAEEHH